MALTMSEERFAEIRKKVMEQRRLAAKVEKIMSEPGKQTFSNVDDFLAFLDRVEPAPDEPAGRPDKE